MKTQKPIPNVIDVVNINDIRNGLLLTQLLHAATALGLGQIAFVKVKIMIIDDRHNFAMEDTDVPMAGPAVLHAA